MRTDYYHQLRRHLEPEISSVQSKGKSQPEPAAHRNSVAKLKQESFRNQKTNESFASFDTNALN